MDFWDSFQEIRTENVDVICSFLCKLIGIVSEREETICIYCGINAQIRLRARCVSTLNQNDPEIIMHRSKAVAFSIHVAFLYICGNLMAAVHDLFYLCKTCRSVVYNTLRVRFFIWKKDGISKIRKLSSYFEWPVLELPQKGSIWHFTEKLCYFIRTHDLFLYLYGRKSSGWQTGRAISGHMFLPWYNRS